MEQHEAQIRALLGEYEKLLNDASAEGIAALYATDGIFMPQGLPTASGREATLAAYRNIFDAISLTIGFEVDEIVVGNGIATALTRSTGSVRVNATGDEAPESNREIFVLAQEDGDWRISRYMFNKAA